MFKSHFLCWKEQPASWCWKPCVPSPCGLIHDSWHRVCFWCWGWRGRQFPGKQDLGRTPPPKGESPAWGHSPRGAETPVLELWAVVGLGRALTYIPCLAQKQISVLSCCLSLPSQVAEFEAKKTELFSCCSLSLPPSLARHGDSSWRRLWLCWVGAAPVPSPPRAPPRCPFPGDTVTCGDGQRHLAPGTGAGQLCYKRNREEATNIGVV